jgi:hypothetical protein
MKQREEIIGLMEGKIAYSNKTLSHLSKLIEEFPYFQTAHFLHTLNLLHLKDAHFIFDLRKTAVYVPDRKQLFFRVEDNFFDPELMKMPEDETIPLDSSFNLIDSFLSKDNKNENRQAIELESSPISTDYASYFLSGKTENVEAPPMQHQDAIDKFLEQDAISPLKINLEKQDEPDEPEIELPEPVSEQANSDSFFSETLAKIYIKQKKYGKALEVIRKLNLLYPEKNRYFADQIRFLEKLIINTNKIK